MLSFYHIRIPMALRANERRREGSQRLEIDAGGVSQRPRPAGRWVAHPARDLQAGEPRPLTGRATHDPQAIPTSHRLDLDLLSGPGVPSIVHFQHVGIVGVQSLGCTTAGGRIWRWPWIVPSPDPAYRLTRER